MEGLTVESYRSMSEAERKKVKKDQLENIILNIVPVGKEIIELRKSIDSLREDILSYRKEQVESSKIVTELVVANVRLEDNNKKLTQEVRDLQQYTRRNNIEIVGLQEGQNSAEDEKNALKLFKKIGVEVKDTDIEACHRIPTKRKDKVHPVIVRFVSRKVRDRVHFARQKLKSLDSKIFINDHLSPFNRYLFNLGLMRKKELNYRYIWTRNGVLFMRQMDGSDAIKILSETDLNNL